VSEFAQQVVNGLAAGTIYALIAVGYNLVYGLLGLINFAHGHVYMVGTFVVLSLMAAGLPFPLALVGGMIVGALLGLLIERVAYRPLRSANRIVPTVSAVAASLVLENAATLIWGPQSRRFDAPLPDGTISILGVRLSAMHGIVFGVAALIALLLWVFVEKSSWGRNVRAIRDDLPTAQLMGIAVNRTVSGVYAVGSVLGVVAGVLFAAYYNTVFVGMGFSGTLNAFTAAVIGGIGSIKGSFMGGLALGVIQAIAIGTISSGYMNAVTFVVLIVFLLVRPLGLLGRAEVTRA
jgi:branched-chain amino acid transport system permease protein